MSLSDPATAPAPAPATPPATPATSPAGGASVDPAIYNRAFHGPAGTGADPGTAATDPISGRHPDLARAQALLGQPANAPAGNPANAPAGQHGNPSGNPPAANSLANPAAGNPPAGNPANAPAANPATQPAASAPQGAASAAPDYDPQADPDNQPITDFSKLDLGIDPAKLDAAVLGAFGKTAVDIGLTPYQARALAQWQVNMIAEAGAAHQQAQEATLRKAWGNAYEANRGRVLGLCSRLDRVPGLEGFSQGLVESGAANDARVVQGLYHIAAMVGEDSLGSLRPGPASKPETAYEGICEAFARARGAR